jgi:glutathione S-transferase
MLLPSCPHQSSSCLEVSIVCHFDLAIWDTLVITEYLYESFPKVWPESKTLRARARSFCGEVHSAMAHLREAMPVNTRGRNRSTTITPGVQEDIQRVFEIWEECSDNFPGPWLLGDFCAADIMFAPIATRFQTYGVNLSGTAKVYHDQILSQPLVSEWLALGEQEEIIIEQFELEQQK